MHRPPLPQNSNDSMPCRLTPGTAPSNGVPSVSDVAETWRRNGPLPRQPDEPILLQRRSSISVAFMPPPPPAPLDHIQTLADGKQEDLEIVDFTDMGKFVGETASGVSSAEQKASRRASRPVASDFFDDVPTLLNSQPLSPSVQNDIDTWRRKTPLIQVTTSDQQIKGLVNKDGPEGNFVTDPSTSEQVYKANEDSRYPSQLSPSSQRTPRTQSFYHQAPMSSLVDAMSRIKGAIHDMHVEELSKENVPPEAEAPVAQAPSAQSPIVKPKERWVPPSLRGRTVEFQEEIPEDFYLTVMEPLPSPKPVWNNLVVRLPSKGQESEQVHRRQLQFFSRPQVFRWDILSFEPPVEGMTKRGFSVNDVLFRPNFYKGKIKYRVHLPCRRNGPRSQSAVPMASRTNSYGAFGKQNGADASTSWRKPTSLPLARPDAADEGVVEVNATSRSPPPEPESSSPAVGINLKVEVSPPESSALPARTRSQPKMPEGSGVAFYRGSRIDVPEAEPKLLVNFIVSSEIDDPQCPQSEASQEDPIVSSLANGAVETIHEPGIGKGSKDDETKDGKTVSPPAESETPRISDSKNSDIVSSRFNQQRLYTC
jgi:serine/arginine repetitive matrix protein 2